MHLQIVVSGWYQHCVWVSNFMCVSMCLDGLDSQSHQSPKVDINCVILDLAQVKVNLEIVWNIRKCVKWIVTSKMRGQSLQ
jgi:hypothetical protein